jgi:hypothetical protein
MVEEERCGQRVSPDSIGTKLRDSIGSGQVITGSCVCNFRIPISPERGLSVDISCDGDGTTRCRRIQSRNQRARDRGKNT